MSENTTTTGSKWWTSFISPQMLIAILMGFGSLVVFWTNQNNTTKDVGVLKDQMSTKADVKTTDAAGDRIQRITNNFILRRQLEHVSSR
jgi:hypothetical protein